MQEGSESHLVSASTTENDFILSNSRCTLYRTGLCPILSVSVRENKKTLDRLFTEIQSEISAVYKIAHSVL